MQAALIEAQRYGYRAGAPPPQKRELKQDFEKAIAAYFARLPPWRADRPPPVLADLEDGHGETKKMVILPNPCFYQRLLDVDSYEHRKNFLVYLLVVHLRPLLSSASVFEEIRRYAGLLGNERLVEKINSRLTKMEMAKAELRMILCAGKWPEGLTQAEKSGNALAEKILDVLRGHFGRTDEEREESFGALTEEALVEFRVRLRRGQISRDDPWWPKRRLMLIP